MRLYIILSAALCAIGALVHLAAIPLGADWYSFIGAPYGLARMLDYGSLRPAITCVIIASALMVWSAYALSAAGLIPRLPAQRAVLGLVATVLIVRSFVLPALAAWEPRTLAGICGRCQQLNGFVLFTSALCLLIGCGLAVAAVRPAPANATQQV